MSQGDKAELGTLLQSCRERLRAFIRKRVPGKEDADDIWQEISYQFIRANTLLQPVEQVNAWLFRAARNEITDRSRKKKEIPLSSRLENEDAEGWIAGEEFAEVLFGNSRSPEEEFLGQLAWEEIELALAELPEAQRQIFEQTEIQGLSYKQISEESGLPVNTLLSRKHKAVLHLRERLQDLYDEIMES